MRADEFYLFFALLGPFWGILVHLFISVKMGHFHVDQLRTRFAQGEALSRIEQVEPDVER